MWLWTTALLLTLAAATRCQVSLVFSSDLAGHYAPYQPNTGIDCNITKQQSSQLSKRLRILELEEENDTDDSVLGRWADEAQDGDDGGDDCVGGIARQAGTIEDILNATKANASTFSISAGNIVGTGEWELVTDHQPASTAATAAQYQVMGLGPNEFWRGADFLKGFLGSLVGKIPVVACNVRSEKLSGVLTNDSVIINSTLGVVGFVHPRIVQETMTLDPEIQIDDPVPCVTHQVNRLKEQSVDFIVALGSGHLRDLEALRNISGLNAIVVSGLSVEEKVNITRGAIADDGDIPVLATKGNGEYVANVAFVNATVSATNVTHLDSNAKRNNKIENDVSMYESEVYEFFNQTIHVLTHLEGGNCTSRECVIGDLITDSLLVAAYATEWFGSDRPRPLAVWPGKDINGTIDAGNVTISQLYELLPNVGQVAIGTCSGDVLLELFAKAVSDIDREYTDTDNFLQVAGVRVTYDLDLEPEYRPKYLMNMCFTCSPQQFLAVTPHLNYTVVMPAYFLDVNSTWREVVDSFYQVWLADFTAREAVISVVHKIRFVKSPVYGRISFTNIPPNDDDTGDTAIAIIVTCFICMVIFGLGLVGFRAWSNRQGDRIFGSRAGLAN